MQNVIALSIVAIAVAYLAVRCYRLFFTRRSRPGCGSGCSSCPATSNGRAESLPIVTIAPLGKPHNRLV